MSMICVLYAASVPAARQVLRDPAGVHDLLESLERSDSVLSLEKSWHGLHFVLTGTAWEGEPPLNFLASGGVPAGDEDVGYGPARILDAADVAKLDRALGAISNHEFARRFDPVALARSEIYPQIWDEPVDDLRQEYGDYFQALKRFVHVVAQSGQALIVAIQ